MTVVPTLRVIAAGASRDLVNRLIPEMPGGITVSARFGPVGEVHDRVSGGEPCDVVITSAAGLADLVADGLLVGRSSRDVGSVVTALAVRDGDETPDLTDGLDRILLDADALYCPDPRAATAGRHLWSVLGRMGIVDMLVPRLRAFPHGAAAMAALAESDAAAPIGCTQLTEILATPGVRPAGALPAPYDLATVYRVAVGVGAGDPESAARFVDLVTGTAHAGLRASLGFEPVGPSR